MAKFEILRGRDEYRRFAADCRQLSIFMQPWWLDAVAGEENWSAVMAIHKEEGTLAALPYCTHKSRGLRMVRQPLLTPHLGPWFRLPDTDTAQRSGIKEKLWYWELTAALLDNLPSAQYYLHHLDPAVSDWLPWHWKGYRQTTRYSFRLQLDRSETVLFSQLKGNIRTNIRKASEQVTISDDQDWQRLYRLMEHTFSRQDKRIPLTPSLVERIWLAARKNEAARIWLATDKDGKDCAAVMCVWDRHCAYLLLSGIDTARGNLGALHLLYWEAVRSFCGKLPWFDFEGSMLPGVAPVFLSYGTEQVPFFRVTRIPSRVLETLFLLSGRLS